MRFGSLSLILFLIHCASVLSASLQVRDSSFSNVDEFTTDFTLPALIPGAPDNLNADLWDGSVNNPASTGASPYLVADFLEPGIPIPDLKGGAASAALLLLHMLGEGLDGAQNFFYPATGDTSQSGSQDQSQATTETKKLDPCPWARFRSRTHAVCDDGNRGNIRYSVQRNVFFLYNAYICSLNHPIPS